MPLLLFVSLKYFSRRDNNWFSLGIGNHNALSERRFTLQHLSMGFLYTLPYPVKKFYSFLF